MAAWRGIKFWYEHAAPGQPGGQATLREGTAPHEHIWDVPKPSGPSQLSEAD